MSEIQRILDQFRKAYNGDAWHGDPVLKVLQGITAKQAFMRPIPEAHNIWEILLHITAWEGEVLRRLQTGILQMPEEGDWCSINDSSDFAWQVALERFQMIHLDLDDAIGRLTEEHLDEILGTSRERELGSGVSVYTLLHGIIQHSLYHAGQIALLKKSFYENE